MINDLKRKVHEETGLSNLAEVTPLMMVPRDLRFLLNESVLGLIFLFTPVKSIRAIRMCNSAKSI